MRWLIVAKFVRSIAVCLMAIVCLSGALVAQSPAPETSSQIDDLKALVFVLQTKLAVVEKELGEEKARRAAYEIEQLQRARETLDPAIKKKLGLPVPEASKPDQKPAPTPPK